MNKKNVTDAFILFMIAWLFGYLVIWLFQDYRLPYILHWRLGAHLYL